MDKINTFLTTFQGQIETLSIGGSTLFDERTEISSDWLATILLGVTPFCVIDVDNCPVIMEDNDGGSVFEQGINTVLIVDSYNPKQSVLDMLTYTQAFWDEFHLKDYTGTLGQPPFHWFIMTNIGAIDYVQWNDNNGQEGFSAIRTLSWQLRLHYYSDNT